MIIKKTQAVFLCMFIILSLLNIYAIDEQVYLTISRRGTGKTPIGIMDTKNINGDSKCPLAKETDEILVFDLSILGYFEIYREHDMTETEKQDKNHIKENPYYHSRLRAIVFARVEETDHNNIVLYGFVRDPFTAERLLSRRYTGNRRTFRRMVHTFSDDITFALTGEQGIANSKIAAVQVIDRAKEIVLMDYDGRNMVRITDNGSINSSPYLCRERKRIIYISYREGYPNLYLYDIQSREERKITRSRWTKSSPAFSNDGSQIIYSMSVENNTDLFLIKDLDTLEQERLTFARSIETSARFAPNDRQIVFTSDRAGIPNIYLMGTGGSNTRRLTFGGQYYESPEWSACGNMIVFVSMNIGRFDIFVMDIDGRNVRRLTQNQGSNEDPSFSPEGNLIVYSSRTQRATQLMLTNANADFNIPITDEGIHIIQPHWN